MKQEKMTSFIKPADADQKWFIVDAKGKVLGRLASKVARIIRGKDKAVFTPNMDTGDNVIVINAEEIVLTGKREAQKEYFHYSGYPGGLKKQSVKDVREKHPERIVHMAVRGMLPKTRLGNKLIKKLKVYKGSDHPHSAQKPENLSF